VVSTFCFFFFHSFLLLKFCKFTIKLTAMENVW
jgi:hypothetical protein